MFYRRKIILALIQLLAGKVEKIRLQKLLFIFSQKKTDPEYDFVPYKFGCYSFSLKADLNTMVKKGFLTENENVYIKKDPKDYFMALKVADQELLRRLIDNHGHMSNPSLIKYTYINYPFFATQSTIVKEVLQGESLKKVRNATPKQFETVLFTIGYEGVSLEKYLEKLLKNNVKLLVDVRKNPLSMKFGFSKSLLKKYCESTGIEYTHLPEVGISSDKRQGLESQRDYDVLFKEYCATTLKSTEDSQNRILELLKEYKRIALTCFEAKPCQCHRSHLANAITTLPGFDYLLKHI